MENIWNDFDDESKSVIEELTQDNQKFNKLVDKLQTARADMDKKVEIVKVIPTEKVK